MVEERKAKKDRVTLGSGVPGAPARAEITSGLVSVFSKVACRLGRSCYQSSPTLCFSPLQIVASLEIFANSLDSPF